MIEVVLSGFLFWFIIITNIASGRFGYETFSDLDSEAKLQKINTDPKRFKVSAILILIEHISIILLAVMLFVAFSPYNLMLALVWTISRIGEGSIQIYSKRAYWRLLNIAKKYSAAGGVDKITLIESGREILKTKNTIFTLAQVLFSVGTLAYSILFSFYAPVPEVIGWFGITASIIYGFGSGIKLAKTKFKALWGLGGLLILIFELILGGWLIFSPLI